MSSELVELYALLWQYRNDTLLLERRSIFPLCSVFLFLSRCVPSIAQLFICSCALPLWGKDQCHSCVSSVRVCPRALHRCSLSLYSFGRLLILFYTLSYTTLRTIYAALALAGRSPQRRVCGAPLQWHSHCTPCCGTGAFYCCAGACSCACSCLPPLHRTAPLCGSKRGTSRSELITWGVRRAASNAQRN